MNSYTFVGYFVELCTYILCSSMFNLVACRYTFPGNNQISQIMRKEVHKRD